MKFGILGEAKIAREWLVPAILDAGHEVTHIGQEAQAKKPYILFIKALLKLIMKVYYLSHL